MMKIYAAMENTDSTEGRGHMRTFAYFVHKQAALAACKGRGVMGCGDGEVKEIEVYDSINAWEQGKKEEIKQNALKKLTDQERKVLGLGN